MTAIPTAPPTAPINSPADQAARPSRAIIVTLAGLVGYGAYAGTLAVQGQAWQLQALTGSLAGASLLALAGLGSVRLGRVALGLWLTVAGLLLGLLAAGALLSGLGLVLLIVTPLVVGAFSARTLPGRSRWLAVGLAALGGVAVLLLDLLGVAAFRLMTPDMQWVTPGVGAVLLALYAVLLLGVLDNFSLRTKLILVFLTVALIPLAVLAALNDRASRQLVTDTANRALQGVAAQTAQSIDAFIDNTKGIVQTESQHPALRAYLLLPAAQRPRSNPAREIRALLPIWQLRDTRARAYSVLNATGEVILSTNSADIGTDYAQAAFFQTSLASGQSSVSDLNFAPNAAQGDLYFSMLIRDRAFVPIGMLVARYNADVMHDLMENTNGLAGAESFGMLVDDRLVQVAHGLAPVPNYPLIGAATPEEVAALQAAGRLPTGATAEDSLNQPELARQLSAAEITPFFTAPDNMTGSRINQVAVAALTTRPWHVAFFQPRDVFLAPVQQQTRATLLLAAIIAVVVAGAAVLAAQVLAEPIARLTLVAEQVSAGDLGVRAEANSRDEIGALARTFNTMTGRLSEMVTTLELRVSERTGQLQAAADISRATTSVRDLDELLRLALELIRDRFGFYHASIFLLDKDERFAVLRESTGPVGAQLKARGHKLGVGSKSLIGWVTRNRQPRVALDVGEDPFHFKNPLLPDTRSELAIPLSVGDRLLGVLDVQSTQPNAFGAGDLQVIQTVADQLSVAIENALLFARTEASLNELSQLYQRMTSASWRGLLRGKTTEKTFEATTGVPNPSGTTTLPLLVPLVLRDQTVGYIELHGRRPEEWSAEERAALNNVAGQVASALESAALLEETQRRRMQEQVINDITQQMRASLNPAAVAQSGARELGRALGATEVIVRLTPGSMAPRPAGEAGER